MINDDQSPARLSLIPRNLRRPALQARQDDRLRATLKWASANSVFWANRIGGVDLDAPGIRSKLAEIPFTSKEELLAEQDAEPPFGRIVCVPPSPGSRVFSTSGTTGNSFLRVFSDSDWRRSTASVAESIRRVATSGDLLMLTSPADGLMGPSLAEAATRRVGAIPISAGKWSTEARVRFIQSAGPSAIAGTTSYLLHLGTRLREAGGAPRMPRGLMCFGEPGAGADETLAKFRALFGDEVLIEDGYGLTEVGPISSGCTLNRELHLREESLLAECVDPLTGEPAPEGVLGELVFTTLTIEAQPVIRYRTGDLARVTSTPCACGSPARRLINSVEGRADDMIWYRGLNLFPAAFAAAVVADERLSDEFELVVDEGNDLTTLILRVEIFDVAQDDVVKREVADVVRSRIGVDARVEAVRPGDLQLRTPNGKVRRVRRINTR